MENSVIVLKYFTRYTNNKCMERELGLYRSWEDVEKHIKVLYESDAFSFRDSLFFICEEYEFADPSINGEKAFDYWYSKWITTRKYKFIYGKLTKIHVSETRFNGYIDDGFGYKVGDIIEYIEGLTECWADTKISDIKVCVVGALPVSADIVTEKGLELDTFDDSYLCYRLGDSDTHEHVDTLAIVGLAKVTENERERYMKKLKEMESGLCTIQ